MPALIQSIKRHPLFFYFLLAYALTWILTPLIAISPLYGLPGLFAPAIAAVLVTHITEGREAVRQLLGRLRIWRVGAQWYLFALAFPLPVSAIIMYLGVLFGAPNQVQLSPVTGLSLVIFMMVVGEEIGWRGYALPKLMESQPALQASLVLGILWGLWHLPTFLLPGLPQSNVPIPAYLLYTMALSVLFTWLYQHTQGSLLLATLFHGAIDIFGLINPALDPSLRWWIMALVYAAAALIVAVVYGVNLSKAGSKGMRRQPSTQSPPVPPAAP